jgi:RHS repeat-associated protein
MNEKYNRYCENNALKKTMHYLGNYENYDAWGKQTLTSGTGSTNRGYLAQEHLNEFALINLNARLYDPVLARFMGMDPYVQAPGFTQSFNRYSYGLNNPFVYTDANGEVWWLVPVIVAAVFAVGNTAAHAIRGDINNFGDGLKYFFQGAITGFALGCVWQFAPLITWQGVGQAIQTTMTYYAGFQAVVGIMGTAAGAINDARNGLELGAKTFLGNFINTNIEDKIEGNFDEYVLSNLFAFSDEFLQAIHHLFHQQNIELSYPGRNPGYDT